MSYYQSVLVKLGRKHHTIIQQMMEMLLAINSFRALMPLVSSSQSNDHNKLVEARSELITIKSVGEAKQLTSKAMEISLLVVGQALKLPELLMQPSPFSYPSITLSNHSK